MSRIAYVNGHYVPHRAASVSIEDRGFLFADAVYEVCEIHRGALIDAPRHLERLHRSLRELRIAPPMADAALLRVMREVRARNRVSDGYVYVQVTRGAARRDHVFPDPPVRPGVVVTARALSLAKREATAAKGVAVITLPDLRWKRVDIKTTGLTANVMARQAAREAGAAEAWFVDAEGFVTEGAAANAWIVTTDHALVTRKADGSILRGVTRQTLIDLLTSRGIRLEERPFTMAEALAAREAFITGATTLIMPVVRIDGAAVGDGWPGPLALDLRARFHDAAARM
jgi:D-alanine transaminase